ncbi:tetratricopeptide repeat protein [Nocardiopsis dassonvillei]|uniref:ATP/GTP-binding protein n=1 Tax=Nocardiopsis dassonvillei (strain ATCC 23218 / DSM 43111 / CIP 107115 / JCM 7437 / KCTC 9190 / NBRC 14626 / NCTC 10488 / NRRL B-5397 / IMRU 509) TaxID=446468 RepID=D7B5Q6_NOCDD|nr:ATP/GTP-binding protein [Nocardiopsis dassonvillei subsp. dassonvillei DSM 43111]NKY82185.1 tetratricopeptide repeat protein [Nocardiopsis dassonvillei]VEI89658.1 Predicted ATPase [Nocardiopsis dassonvillei]
MEGMVPPPDAHDNASTGAVHGQLLQVRDIHGGVTLHAPAPAPPPLADVSLDPPRPATAVRGREGLLEALGGAMEAGAPVPHVLTGPGGFGKTTVAAALAERARRDGWTVFWVRPGSVASSMVEAAVEVGGSRQEAERVKGARRQAARWVWRHLDAAARPWLLVIDNADRPEKLDPENRPGDQLGWMRASPGGFVLVTSRVDDPAQWAPARVHRIGELEGSAASEALADHAGAGGAAGLAGAEELARRLGGVPLALSLAGRILATHRVLFPDAHALLARLGEGVGALDELAAPFVTGGDVERGLLSGVWELSLRLVEEREPRAVPLLKLLAVLGPDASEVPLRRLPLSELDGGVLGSPTDADLARAVNALVVHGLVSVVSSQGETALRLHPLVSETVRSGFGEEDLELVNEAERLLAWQRDRDLQFELRVLYEIVLLRTRLHPHEKDAAMVTVGKLTVATTAVHRKAFVSLVAAARALLRLGAFEEAEETLSALMAFAEKQFGRYDRAVFSAKHHLAESWLYQGRVEEADEAFRALHEDRSRALGHEHVETLDSLYQLGLIALRQERWSEAAATLEEVGEARVRVAGEEDPLALLALQNRAYATMCQGDPATAEVGFRRVHAVRRRVLGADHHMTADAAFYVARAAQEKGDARRALVGFTEVLRVWIMQLGQEHHQVKMVEQHIAEVEELIVQGGSTPSGAPS